MVSRIRIGPEGGPFVEIDEDNGTLKLDAPSGNIDLQANDLLSLGDLDLSGNQLQNAVLLGAALGGALNADGQDIENIATVRSDDIENDQTVTTNSLSSTNINNADTVTTQDLVVNGTATGPFGSDLQGCRAFLSSNQSTTFIDKIQFDSVVYDEGNNFDTTSHNFTCPQTGLYIANLQVAYDAGGDNEDRSIRIGSATNAIPSNKGAFTKEGSADEFNRLNATTMNKYTQGDTIAAFGGNNVANDSLSSGGGGGDTFLEVAFLGSL